MSEPEQVDHIVGEAIRYLIDRAMEEGNPPPPEFLTTIEELDFDTAEAFGLDGTQRSGLAAYGPAVQLTFPDGTTFVGVNTTERPEGTDDAFGHLNKDIDTTAANPPTGDALGERVSYIISRIRVAETAGRITLDQAQELRRRVFVELLAIPEEVADRAIKGRWAVLDEADDGVTLNFTLSTHELLDEMLGAGHVDNITVAQLVGASQEQAESADAIDIVVRDVNVTATLTFMEADDE